MKYLVLQYSTGEYLARDNSYGGYPFYKTSLNTAWILPKNSINLRELMRIKETYPETKLHIVEFEVTETARYV